MLQTSTSLAAETTGPLRVHPSNSRYFTDGNGKAIFLTGLHTWSNFQERGLTDPPPDFDYNAYLNLLERHHHNFIRLWVWEHAAWNAKTTDKMFFHSNPYLRTGPGTALDGKAKFDLKQFNQAYFTRLRKRVMAAAERRIYVGVMLFNGWSIQKKGSNPGNPWPGHPFNSHNNINGIDGDLNGNGEGEEVHTLDVPVITRLQEAYVRKVIDTLNDLDNVLYEITNESPIETKNWQYHMVSYIKNYQAGKAKQHPVGMTYFYKGRGGAMDALFKSPADWISPGNDGGAYDYSNNPPAANGIRVLITDTDHLNGGADRAEVWKNFTRGLHFIGMDTVPFYEDPIWGSSPAGPQWEIGQKSMGHVLAYAKRLNLAAMVPRSDLCSSNYCLANPGFEYLIYIPSEGSKKWYLRGWYLRWRRLQRGAVTVDLAGASGELRVEWLNPTTGETTLGGTVTGGAKRSFTAPFRDDAVLYVLKRQ